MLAHMLSHGLALGTPRRMAIDIARQSFNLIIGFGLSIPFFFVTPQRLGAVDRPSRLLVARFATTAGAGATGPAVEPEARVTQPPVATGRAGSATQLDQEPT